MHWCWTVQGQTKDSNFIWRQSQVPFVLLPILLHSCKIKTTRHICTGMCFVTTCHTLTTAAIKCIQIEVYWWHLCAEVPFSKYLGVAGGEWYPACRGCSPLHKMLMALGRLGRPLPSPTHPPSACSEAGRASWYILLYFNDASGDISMLKGYFSNCQHRQNGTQLAQCKFNYGWLKWSWGVVALLPWPSTSVPLVLPLHWCWGPKCYPGLGKRK